MFHIVLLSILALAACTASGPATTDIVEASGTIELNQGPPNDILLGGAGNGTVFLNGRTYRFTIGGLGVQGSGIAILQTTGQVYQLRDIAKFPGTYRKAPSGAPGSDLWLQNEQEILMRIATPAQGRMPDLGLDALRVELE